MTKLRDTDYQCDDCKRSFHTEKGLQRHREREVCP